MGNDENVLIFPTRNPTQLGFTGLQRLAIIVIGGASCWALVIGGGMLLFR